MITNRPNLRITYCAAILLSPSLGLFVSPLAFSGMNTSGAPQISRNEESINVAQSQSIFQKRSEDEAYLVIDALIYGPNSDCCYSPLKCCPMLLLESLVVRDTKDHGNAHPVPFVFEPQSRPYKHT